MLCYINVVDTDCSSTIFPHVLVCYILLSLETGAEWHVDCGDVVEIETRCRIPIWRTFGRIQWHVIPEPSATLQGAATWWIHCHDSRTTCHIAGRSHLAKSMSWSCHIAGCKNSIRHIENRFSPYFLFSFFMQFRLWCAPAFVSFPIHLFYNQETVTMMKPL